jgi:hypothetical protein
LHTCIPYKTLISAGRDIQPSGDSEIDFNREKSIAGRRQNQLFRFYYKKFTRDTDAYQTCTLSSLKRIEGIPMEHGS